MLKTNRKPIKYTSSYRFSRKKRPFPRLWMILLSIPLALIVLELLMRVVVGFSGKAPELDAYQGEPLNITAYRLKYLNSSGQPFEGLPNQGRLKVKYSPLMGYRLVGNQQSNVWGINAQGFRSDQAIAPSKSKDEVRIFILGGSTAFGQLSSNNQTTFASKLETLLNQQVATQKSNPKKFRPDVMPYFADELAKAMALPSKIRESRYRVVNAAVPGYMSSNELSQLALQILTYQPNFVVVVDGYADLLVPSSQEGTDIPGNEQLLTHASGHFFSDVNQSLKRWVYQSYLIRGFQYWVLRPQDAVHQLIPPAGSEKVLAQHLTADSKELSQRTTRYRNNLEQIARLTSAAKIPLILALQPEISGRNPKHLSPHEKKILDQLGSTYTERVKTGYTQLQQSIEQVKADFPKGVVTLNLNNAYSNFAGEAFQDAIHLTDEANTVLADQLYETIAKQLLVQPKPNSAATAPGN
ncbi:SGNH/GDSL hydrolase family protein [Kovacikia minuta CCNUW1]|uniref:SGNH/GDSL hydrolase family protein n=1 Tax=Kovacikia minuta TaxID=2931930 RepID=UPI001CC97CF7|nr:SGNH/GDSL hydrolase family protein [Kovacikia minuta]UBF23586.1 SGNH/GDSL hydrolase family protein [Kovacikia minuta CCNUW1]